MKEIWGCLNIFLDNTEGNFVCPTFLQFWYIVNLLKNTDFFVICIHCLLEHAWYE